MKEVKCDDCGVPFDPDGLEIESLLIAEQIAIAKDYEWHIRGGFTFCPDCREYPEELDGEFGLKQE